MSKHIKAFLAGQKFSSEVTGDKVLSSPWSKVCSMQYWYSIVTQSTYQKRYVIIISCIKYKCVVKTGGKLQNLHLEVS